MQPNQPQPKAQKTEPQSAIRPLTQAEKDRLLKKYEGKLEKPTAAEVAEVAGSGCRQQ